MSNRALRSVVTGAVLLGLLAWGTGELYATMAQKGSVSGKVLGADGKPAVGLGLRMEQEVPMGMQKPGNKAAWGDAGPNPLQNRDGGNKVVARATTDKEGKFSFPNLEPGAYILVGGAKNIGWIYYPLEVQEGKDTKLDEIRLTKN